MTFRCPNCGEPSPFPVTGFICFSPKCNGQTTTPPDVENLKRFQGLNMHEMAVLMQKLQEEAQSE